MRRFPFSTLTASLLSAALLMGCGKKDANDKPAAKPAAVKKAGDGPKKADEAKADEAKADEAKADEADEAAGDEAAGDKVVAKVDEAKADEAKGDKVEAKVEAKADEAAGDDEAGNDEAGDDEAGDDEAAGDEAAGDEAGDDSADEKAEGDETAKADEKAGDAAEIGKPAPDFTLKGLGGVEETLSKHKGKVVVLEWFNPDCPFVGIAHGDKGALKTAAKDYAAKGVVWLAINSNAEGKQGHGEDTNKKGKDRFGMEYPILFDLDGTVGKQYDAQRTPHVYVIDKEGVLRYRGAVDNTGGGEPEGEVERYLDNALTQVLEGKPVEKAETKAWGCSVKYAD